MSNKKWILCSERLPNRSMGVLLTIGASFSDNLKWNYVTSDYFYFHDKIFIDNSGKDALRIIAWRPLPKPFIYKKKRKKKNKKKKKIKK